MSLKVTAIIFLISLSVSGCSLNKTATTKKNKEMIEEIYKIVAIATTPRGKRGSPCSDAVGVIKIHKHIITGKATDSIGRRFIIAGKSLKGKITGGFALTKHLAVKFSGNISQSGQANGSWKDIFHCQGTWKATRVLKRKARKYSKSIKT